MTLLCKRDRKRLRLEPSLRALIGVDEAGRGALAGPVVAAAVVASPEFYASVQCRRQTERVRDSKLIPEVERESLAETLHAICDAGFLSIGVGVASVSEIALHNILGASRIAMRRAIESLPLEEALGVSIESLRCDAQLPAGGLWENLGPETEGATSRADPLPVRILVDGLPLRPFVYAHEAVVGGDGLSLAIAMASIIAKTSRDALMRDLAQQYPDYGFDSNKGYAGQRHFEALDSVGPSPVHRELFLRNWKDRSLLEQTELAL